MKMYLIYKIEEVSEDTYTSTVVTSFKDKSKAELYIRNKTSEEGNYIYYFYLEGKVVK
jgi:hypothetical protein